MLKQLSRLESGTDGRHHLFAAIDLVVTWERSQQEE